MVLAVTEAVPALIAVTIPVVLTVATEVLLLLHVIGDDAFDGYNVYDIAFLSPISIVAEGGETMIEEGLMVVFRTTTLHVALGPELFSNVIVALPALTALTYPLSLTVTILLLLDVNRIVGAGDTLLGE